MWTLAERIKEIEKACGVSLPTDLITSLFISIVCSSRHLLLLNQQHEPHLEQIIQKVIQYMFGCQSLHIRCDESTVPSDILDLLLIQRQQYLALDNKYQFQAPTSQQPRIMTLAMSKHSHSEDNIAMLSRTRSQDAPTKKKKQPRQEALACPFIIRDFHLSSPEVQSVIHQLVECKKIIWKGSLYEAPKNLLIIGLIPSLKNHKINHNLLKNFLLSQDITIPRYVYPNTSSQSNCISSLEIEDCKKQLEQVYVSIEIERYIRDLVIGIRNHPLVAGGINARVNSDLRQVAKTWAFVIGSDYVSPHHIAQICDLVFSHQIMLQSEIPYAHPSIRSVALQTNTSHILREVLTQTPPPL